MTGYTTDTFGAVCNEANKLRIELGHHYVSTEHFLLACFNINCVAGRILKNLGVEQDDVLKELQRDPTGEPNTERETD